MYEAKKILSTMGMEYKKIHSCPNDSHIVRKRVRRPRNCPKCKTSRYKVKKVSVSERETTKRQPLKALWYLPIIPRFKRLFTSEATAKKLRWHSMREYPMENIFDPTDSPQWKKIDEMFPQFGNEPRNLLPGFVQMASIRIELLARPIVHGRFSL
ncbi:hypothetical protein K1719_007495 [Acacia pycnantha]|nr:hypothetical protein K1719_007495 [Acacia pycnantha]